MSECTSIISKMVFDQSSKRKDIMMENTVFFSKTSTEGSYSNVSTGKHTKKVPFFLGVMDDFVPRGKIFLTPLESNF